MQVLCFTAINAGQQTGQELSCTPSNNTGTEVLCAREWLCRACPEPTVLGGTAKRNHELKTECAGQCVKREGRGSKSIFFTCLTFLFKKVQTENGTHLNVG